MVTGRAALIPPVDPVSTADFRFNTTTVVRGRPHQAECFLGHDRALRQRSQDSCAGPASSVQTAGNASDALREARAAQLQGAIVDLRLTEEDSGLALIPELRDTAPDARILMLTGYASIPTAVEAVKRGADHYLAKPAEIEAILHHLGFPTESTPTPATEPSEPSNQRMSVNRLEWEHIQRVLQEHQGNISATARALGMHRRTLQRKLRKRPTGL